MQGLIVMGLYNLARDSRFQRDFPDFSFFGYACEVPQILFSRNSSDKKFTSSLVKRYTIVTVLKQQNIGTTCQPLKNLPAKTLTNN